MADSFPKNMRFTNMEPKNSSKKLISEFKSERKNTDTYNIYTVHSEDSGNYVGKNNKGSKNVNKSKKTEYLFVYVDNLNKNGTN